MEIPILYSDDSLLVIDKPAGIPVLPDGWDKDAPYLVKLLEEMLVGRGSTLTGTRPDPCLWVVHRLDKVTSGVMVFARTAESHRALNMQFEQHTVRKVYHAICVGAPAWDEHTARHKLRVNVGHSHRTVVDNGRGIAAETQFKLLKRYQGHGLLECIPATGRTHQIRVHAYALGYPLLGDSLYTPLSFGHPPILNPKNGGNEGGLLVRPALHAVSLTITHPVTAERLTFSAPYPPDFTATLTHLST